MSLDSPLRAVDVPSSAPWGTTTAHLVPGPEPLLVDPAARTDSLDRAVADVGVTHLAVTHTHPDHVAAVADYADDTGATVWCRRGREARFERATGVRADRTFVEGTRVGPALVLDTPGHAVDHVAFEVDGDVTGVERGGRTVLCGDLAVAEGSVMVGAPEGDMRAYLTALRRLYARHPDRLCPAHGGAIDRPRETLERLVTHRLGRERRVLESVADGARDVESVLDAAYDKDLSGVREYARATVVAHLEKLAVEGRVAWDPETGRVAPA